MRLKWLFRAVAAVAALAPCLLGLQVLGPAASAATLPAVTGVSPNTGSYAGGTSVVISGTGFTGATEVLFGGVTAPSFSVVGDSEITATSPYQPIGTVDVSVLTPAGGSAATSADSFTYELGPRISGISPHVSPTSGGTTVTLTGTGFTGATSVRFNGAAVASNLTVVSDTQLTVTTPPHSAGGVDVTVFTPDGNDTTTLFAYADTPVVSGISPSSGPANGGTSVTITGSGFTGASQVSFGSVGSAGLVVLSDTTMAAGVPAQAEGDIVDVTVTNPAGTSATSAADQFTYTAPVPTATALFPGIGPTAGGTQVTVDGTGFVAGQTSVTIGGTVIPAASVTVLNANVLTFITPAHAAGIVSVTVTAPGGPPAPVPGGFIYQPPRNPVVTAVSPSSGSTAGGTSVTITGTGFNLVSRVSFGSVAATRFTVNSSTSITAVAPAGSAGTVDVRVTSRFFGTSPIGAADHFTYQATATALASSANPSVVGEQVTFKATVSPAPDGGAVAFTQDGTPISACSAQPVDTSTGIATCQLTYAGTGAHSITAAYSGDDAFGPSSGTLTQTVNKITTTTTVASSGNPSALGAQVTYTATISPVPDGGTVTFTDGGTTITACAAQAVNTSTGTATCTTTPGTAAAHNIIATFTGTSAYAGSQSATVTQVVTATQCASLAGCNLSGLNLSGANLTGANLTGANLNGATLTGADLGGANLTGANFSKANLTGADLNGAAVTGTTNFNKVTWSGTTCPDGTNSNADGGTCVGHPVVAT